MTRHAPITVAAVDDHTAILTAVEATVLAAGPDLEFVGGYTSVPAMLASPLVADVVVLDLLLGEDDEVSLGWIPDLVGRGSQVVLHTSKEKPALIRAAMHLGALGLHLKRDDVAGIVDTIRTVAAGDRTWSSLQARALLEDPAAMAALAPRHVELLNHLYDGLSVKQASKRMGVAQSTCATYLREVRTRYLDLGRPITNGQSVLREAFREGHLDPLQFPTRRPESPPPDPATPANRG